MRRKSTTVQVGTPPIITTLAVRAPAWASFSSFFFPIGQKCRFYIRNKKRPGRPGHVLDLHLHRLPSSQDGGKGTEATAHQHTFIGKLRCMRAIVVVQAHGIPGTPHVTFVEILWRNGDKLALVVGGAWGFGKTIDPSWPQYVAFAEHHAIDERFEVFIICQRNGLAKNLLQYVYHGKNATYPTRYPQRKAKALEVGLAGSGGVVPYSSVSSGSDNGAGGGKRRWQSIRIEIKVCIIYLEIGNKSWGRFREVEMVECYRSDLDKIAPRVAAVASTSLNFLNLFP